MIIHPEDRVLPVPLPSFARGAYRVSYGEWGKIILTPIEEEA